MLRDEEAERIESQLGTSDRPTLARWLQLLLEDRRERGRLLQSQARRLAHLRSRLKQAGEYFDGLVTKAQEEVQSPWPGKLPCPHCGAPAALVRIEQRQQGHRTVHDHPDGTKCQPPPRTPRGAQRG